MDVCAICGRPIGRGEAKVRIFSGRERYAHAACERPSERTADVRSLPQARESRARRRSARARDA